MVGAKQTSRQCAEIIRKGRKNNVDKECLGIVKYFQQKQKEDESFYFAMDLGDDGMLQSVLWADGRARAAYLQFCDVLVFDVNYNTNKFKMSFAPFTGVNHHLQSSLFGGALLEDETTETSVWLFPNFGDACSKDPCPLLLLTMMPNL